MYAKTFRFPELTFYGADQAERDAHFRALTQLLKHPGAADSRELADECRGFIARRIGCGNKIDTPIHLFIRHSDWAHDEAIAQLFTDYVEAEYIDVDRLISSASTKYEWNSLPLEAAMLSVNADAINALVLHGADTSLVTAPPDGRSTRPAALKVEDAALVGSIYLAAQMKRRIVECTVAAGIADSAPKPARRSKVV